MENWNHFCSYIHIQTYTKTYPYTYEYVCVRIYYTSNKLYNLKKLFAVKLNNMTCTLAHFQKSAKKLQNINPWNLLKTKIHIRLVCAKFKTVIFINEWKTLHLFLILKSKQFIVNLFQNDFFLWLKKGL